MIKSTFRAKVVRTKVIEFERGGETVEFKEVRLSHKYDGWKGEVETFLDASLPSQLDSVVEACVGADVNVTVTITGNISQSDRVFPRIRVESMDRLDDAPAEFIDESALGDEIPF